MPVLSVEVEAKKAKGVDIEAVFARQINRKTFTMTVADRDLTMHNELADRALGIKLITTLLESKSGLRASDVDVKGMVRALGPYDLDIRTIDPDTKKAKNQYRCTVELEAVRGTDPTKRADFKPVRKAVGYMAMPFLQKGLDASILSLRRLGVNMQVYVDPAPPTEAALKPVRDAIGVVVTRWQKEWTDRMLKQQEDFKAALNRDPTLLKDAKKQVEKLKDSLFADMEMISKESEQAADKALVKLASQPNLSYLKTAKVKADPSWFFAGLQMGPKIAVHAESKINLGVLDELKTDLKKAVDDMEKYGKKEKQLQAKLDKAMKAAEGQADAEFEKAKTDAEANRQAAKDMLERLKKMSKATAKIETDLKTARSPKAADVGAYRKQLDALAPTVKRWRDAGGRLEECLEEDKISNDDVAEALKDCNAESSALAGKLAKLLPIVRSFAPKAA